MPHIDINGSALAYTDGGAGEPVITVHGGWTGQAVWQAFASELREDYAVTTYDRLGHADSERPASGYTRRRHEDDLIALVERLGRGPAHLVGNSYGGAVILGVATRRPELVRGLVVHEPALADNVRSSTMDDTRRVLYAIAARVDAGDIADGTRQFFEELALGPGSWDAIPQAFRALAMHNAITFAREMRDPTWARIDPAALARIEAPVLLSQGSTSPAWFGEIVEAMAAAMPRAGRATVIGAGHSPHMTHPAQYAELVGSFLGARGQAHARAA
jgi:pimeloyl-ACP methyl ester carboxylesterase